MGSPVPSAFPQKHDPCICTHRSLQCCRWRPRQSKAAGSAAHLFPSELAHVSVGTLGLGGDVGLVLEEPEALCDLFLSRAGGEMRKGPVRRHARRPRWWQTAYAPPEFLAHRRPAE